MRIFWAFALVLLAARPARAEEREWYGWQIALSDAASIGLMATGKETLALVGGLGWVFGGPIIHSAHEDFGAGGIDLGLRLGLPVVGGIAGFRGSGCVEDCEGLPSGALLGFFLGGVAAMALDYGLLSTHERVALTPLPGGAVVSLAGRL